MKIYSCAHSEGVCGCGCIAPRILNLEVNGLFQAAVISVDALDSAFRG